MPPHLHPRSTATSTLFAGTLLASFVVVGIPHVFPCPRPRTGYAADAGRIELDEDGKPIRRKARSKASDASGASEGDSEAQKATPQRAPAPQKGLNQTKDLDEEAALFRELAAEAEMLEKQAKLARECPVPKPTGWVGRILGFEDQREAGMSGRGREKG
jgi:cytochrome c oxidase assembly factor 2